MVQQIYCKEIDVNTGFNTVVNQELNEELIKLQMKGCKILEVSPPLGDGRKVRFTIRYDDPSIDLGLEGKDDGPKRVTG